MRAACVETDFGADDANQSRSPTLRVVIELAMSSHRGSWRIVNLSLIQRAFGAVRARWPSGAAGRVLLGLIILGVVLRVLAAIGSWPTSITLEDGYQVYSKSNPFLDPQHPAGYALIIAAIGAVSRAVGVLIFLQHLLGIASALMLGAATRRVTGSAWAGLLPAAMILLGADQIFLEHTVMSESWEVLASSAGFYAAVRALDAPSPWWRWPLLTGLALGVAVTIRTAAVALIPVAVIALLIYNRPRARGERQWRAALATACAAVLVLLVYASANATFGQRFNIAPSPGWYLYGQVAQFADCKQFTPPPGTAFLCERRPASQRPSAEYYMFSPHAPAPSHLGQIGTHDALVGAWARRALRAQFGQLFTTTWPYLRSYWVPGSLPARFRATNGGLDPQLDFTFANVYYASMRKRSLEAYYNPFAVHTHHWALQFLHDWQRVVRFGATLLSITTLLTLLGLVIGTRRSRVGVFLFGLGGLSLILAPSFSGSYTGRYTVPMAAPLMAASAITVREVWRLLRSARGYEQERDPPHRGPPIGA